MVPIAESNAWMNDAPRLYREADVRLDMNVVRDILLWIEENQTTAVGNIQSVSVEGHSAVEVAYHVEAMAKEGFLTATIQPIGGMGPDDSGTLFYNIRNITWAGHDLIEYLREPSGVERAVDVAKKIGKGGLMAVYKVLEGEAMERIAAYLKSL